jgi:exopolysaccharide biosynthesis polyprenyl glycosylphosphotransferase
VNAHYRATTDHEPLTTGHAPGRRPRRAAAVAEALPTRATPALGISALGTPALGTPPVDTPASDAPAGSLGLSVLEGAAPPAEPTADLVPGPAGEPTVELAGAPVGRRPAQERLHTASLVLADLVAAAASVLVAQHRVATTWWIVPVLLTLNLGAGLHCPRLTLSVLDDLPALLTRAVVAAGLCAPLLAAPAIRAPLLLRDGTGRDDLRLFNALTAILLLYAGWTVLVRGAVHLLWRRWRRGHLRPTLVVGRPGPGLRLAEVLDGHPEYGLEPIAVIHPLTPEAVEEAIGSTIRQHQVSDLVFAVDGLTEPLVQAAVRTGGGLGCDSLLVYPHGHPHVGRLRRPDRLWGLTCLHLAPPRMGVARCAKRLVDILLAGTALVAISPVLALCALAVRRETGPGVLFRQVRVGLGGRPFELLKFRTLRPVNERESAERWSIANDQRVGPVGRFLRNTSLDELPQLWNVLCGQMSLVGPRPERPYFVREFSRSLPHYADRHRMPVGMTGLAQVHGLRGDTSIEERAWFDNYYIEHWSLWQDVKIVLLTLRAVLRRGES